MPRFVVLEHDSPRGLHWDFMLESGDALATWALPEPPDAAAELAAESLPDHRPAYLDYEGPIASNRGTVRRWDRGTYEVRRRTERQWVVLLTGTRLVGEAILDRLPNTLSSWRFAFRPEAAGAEQGV